MSDQITNQPASPRPQPSCPECGAKILDRLATKCWMCHEPLNAAGLDGGPNPFRLPDTEGDNPGWAVFGVLAILIIAGLAIESPGVLIVLAVLGVPALIRMAVLTERELSAGKPVTPGSIALAVLTSVGVVAVVGFASAAAFFVTCFAACLGGMAMSSGSRGGGDGIFVFAVSFGALVGLTVFVLIIRALSRRKE